MSFEYEKYLRAIKPLPAPTSMAPYLPEVISNWAEEEYRRFMDKKHFEDMAGYLHRSERDRIEANDNIGQEWGLPNMGGWRKF